MLPPGLCDRVMLLRQLASLGSGRWESPGSRTSLWGGLKDATREAVTARKWGHAPRQGLASLSLTLLTGEGNGETLVRGWLRCGIRIHRKVRRPLPLESDRLLPRGCLSRPGPASRLLMRGLPSHLGLSCEHRQARPATDVHAGTTLVGWSRS